MGLDGAYVPFDVAPERLADAVKGLAALGFDGANVTLPHKSSVMPHLARARSDCAARGRGEHLARMGDGLVGHNTSTVTASSARCAPTAQTRATATRRRSARLEQRARRPSA